MVQTYDVLIVEDEVRLAELHADFIRGLGRFNVTGMAGTLAEARRMIEQDKPRLVLLDNYLPDGNGIDLLEYLVAQGGEIRVIFVTAASEMETCSKAIACGAFDYIIKPVSYDRLKAAMERFCRFVDSQQSSEKVDQRLVDQLYNLQSKPASEERRTKGIEEFTLTRVKEVFLAGSENETTDSVAKILGISKTTARRYLEYCVEIQFLTAEIVYGKVGRPERIYRRLGID